METVWDVLLTKTDMEVKKIRVRVQELRDRRDRAAAQKRKLTDLIAEYHGRLSEIQARPHNLSEAASYRQFIVQIQDLLARSEAELKVADESLSLARQELINSESEKLKFESLVEREKTNIRQQENAKEIRSTEESAILQYNWK